MESILETLLSRPDANGLVEKAQKVLTEEHSRRQQFYKDITPSDKAEFIQGEVIFHSPVKSRHNRATLRIAKLLDTFVSLKKLGYVGVEKLLISLTRNDYEPDICFFLAEKSRTFADDQMQFPAPDFIAEVLSESTEGRDRGIKFQDYALHGVKEYWIIDPDKESLEQYLLQADNYELHLKAFDGHVESKAIEGFTIPVRACFDDEVNLQTLKGSF